MSPTPRHAVRSATSPLAVVASLALCAWLIPACSDARDVAWDRLAEGLDVGVWEPGAECAGQVPPLVLVRVDPDRYRFETYHFRDEGLAAPLTIHEWQGRIRAAFLFNAGLFAEDYSYLGVLLKDGRSLGSRTHPGWKGLFVAEPTDPHQRNARVLDLSRESFSVEHPSYREAAQSLMLLDEDGRPRVKRTGKRAHQTVVGEDHSGRILVIKTADAVSMWELAVCLRDGLPRLRHAMAMDGGSSSDVLIAQDLLPPGVIAQPLPPWQPLVDGTGAAHIPLPAIIAVRPRDQEALSRRE